MLILDSAPAEVSALRQSIVRGKINGSAYEGECCCLVGTLEHARGGGPGCVVPRDSGRAAEVFFMRINTGDTPETSPWSARALEIVDEWIAEQSVK